MNVYFVKFEVWFCDFVVVCSLMVNGVCCVFSGVGYCVLIIVVFDIFGVMWFEMVVELL